MRKLAICTGNSRMAATWPKSEITFPELFDKLQNPLRTGETVEQYKKMKNGQRDEAKDKGGFMAGTLKGTKRRKNEVVSRSMITLDGDKFENIAYVMDKHADTNIPDTPEEWLDEFNTFFIYQVLPSIIELWGLNVQMEVEFKKLRPTDRPMTTPLFLLRCVQLGISIRDLDLFTIGLVNDMYAENGNDDYKGYKELATQEDFDRF